MAHYWWRYIGSHSPKRLTLKKPTFIMLYSSVYSNLCKKKKKRPWKRGEKASFNTWMHEDEVLKNEGKSEQTERGCVTTHAHILSSDLLLLFFLIKVTVTCMLLDMSRSIFSPVNKRLRSSCLCECGASSTCFCWFGCVNRLTQLIFLSLS